jgi:SAM-dependent methyltransferase
VGDPATARTELEGLFGRLGADPRRGVCVEVGCGPGRMTGVLAERFDRVVAVDVSEGMLERARSTVTEPNVDFRVVAGDRLETIEDAIADTLICYLVLQHLPERRAVLRYLEEFARVLSPEGRAFVQLPVMDDGIRPRVWRLVRRVAVPVSALFRRGVTDRAAFRGTRLTEVELQVGLAGAGLRTGARDESPESPYRYASEVFLRLEHAA